MKQIQPVIFPLNLGTAIFINCVGSDNFANSVTIYYELLTNENLSLQVGNLYLNGLDYENYNISNDGNQYIYDWSALKLGITLI